MALSRLIVNADDFGYSEAVNRAIVCGFESSLVNSTSLMANMPGFDHAIGLIRKHPFLQQHAGLHLNLTEGYPLSRALSACPTFCGSGGRLTYHRERPLFRLSRRERVAVYEEMEMQLERVVVAGIRPTHLDSHHHAHTEWAIAPLVCRLARVPGGWRIPGCAGGDSSQHAHRKAARVGGVRARCGRADKAAPCFAKAWT